MLVRAQDLQTTADPRVGKPRLEKSDHVLHSDRLTRPKPEVAEQGPYGATVARADERLRHRQPDVHAVVEGVRGRDPTHVGILGDPAVQRTPQLSRVGSEPTNDLGVHALVVDLQSKGL